MSTWMLMPITLQDGRYHMAGTGSIVEYAVKMRQLPETSSMLQLVRRRKLEKGSINALAGVLAKFLQPGIHQ
jgi:aminoglycoside phosphotransferase family enzyme